MLAAKEGKRRAGRAAPPWLTPEQDAEIVAIYQKAILLTEATGILHEVDHLVPLRGASKGLITGRWIYYVSGLHIPSNLRAIPRSLNTRRSNRFYTGDPLIENDERFWVDMPNADTDTSEVDFDVRPWASDDDDGLPF